MVEMEKQAFAAVKEAEAEDVVVEERGQRAQDDVEQAKAAMAVGDSHLGSKGRIAVHVVDVVGEGGIGVVEEGVVEFPRDAFDETGVFVNGSHFETRGTIAKESQ